MELRLRKFWEKKKRTKSKELLHPFLGPTITTLMASSVVLADRQTHSSPAHKNTKPRNRPTETHQMISVNSAQTIREKRKLFQ